MLRQSSKMLGRDGERDQQQADLEQLRAAGAGDQGIEHDAGDERHDQPGQAERAG